jgi:DNA-binding FadR family transcriptional regulator
MPLAAVESPRLYRQIADQLRQLIDRGEFPVGCRLPPERELAEKLGVSRPSVREALIALEVEGRVRIRMGSGVYVAPPRVTAGAVAAAGLAPEGPFEVLEARRLVEGMIAQEVAGRVTAAGVAALDRILDDMAAPGLPGERLIALDRAFHVEIAAMLGNTVLVRCVGDLFDQRTTPYFRQLAQYFENDATWRAAITEHGAIRDALVRRDGAAAAQAMRRHIEASRERFSQSFGDADSKRAGERQRRLGSVK